MCRHPLSALARCSQTSWDIQGYGQLLHPHRVGEGITSRFRLTRETYHRLMEYGYHSWYVLSAVEVATAILKNYRNKASTMLHRASTAIVKWCREKNYGLIHEDLKGLRKNANAKGKRLNKFNGKVQRISKRPKKLKRRLNNWWFRNFLNQISYKCAWEGVKTIESKHTRGSSSTYPISGSKLMKYPKGLAECKNMD